MRRYQRFEIFAIVISYVDTGEGKNLPDRTTTSNDRLKLETEF